jgi:uncharacterized protein YwgA
MRTPIEVLQDKLLLLYLVSSVKKYGFMEGNLKLQKIVFLSEWQLMSNDIKALHFKYFRYRYGPFSKELLCDNQDLQTDGYLTHQFNLTEKAIDLLDYAIEPIMRYGANLEIFNKIDNICATYSKITGLRLTDKVYRMEIVPYDMPGKMIKIRDIPAFIDILVPENFGSRYVLEVPAALMADIEEEFSGKELTQEEERAAIDRSTERLAELIAETKSGIPN